MFRRVSTCFGRHDAKKKWSRNGQDRAKDIVHTSVSTFICIIPPALIGVVSSSSSSIMFTPSEAKYAPAWGGGKRHCWLMSSRKRQRYKWGPGRDHPAAIQPPSAVGQPPLSVDILLDRAAQHHGPGEPAGGLVGRSQAGIGTCTITGTGTHQPCLFYSLCPPCAHSRPRSNKEGGCFGCLGCFGCFGCFGFLTISAGSCPPWIAKKIFFSGLSFGGGERAAAAAA